MARLSELSGESQFFQELWSMRPRLAEAAQEVYDAWDVEDGFGICDQIANAMAGVLFDIEGIEIDEGGWEGDDHAYLIVRRDGEAYEIDIPYYIYEKGGGYSWQRIDDVKFTPDDVVITRL